MTSLPPEFNVYRDILDEILYRDPQDATAQIEMVDGASRTSQVITFADGSQLLISAQVPLPPMTDMTPERVHYIKMSGERGVRWDDGTREVMNLARQSVAYRLLQLVSQVLDELPEREKVLCPTCEGSGHCRQCGGRGCVVCNNEGKCDCCGGRGMVPRL